MGVEDLTNKSVDRALELLNMLSESGKSMSIADICKALSITRATAQAIANSLCAADYIERNPLNGRYTYGFRSLVMGNLYPLQYPFLFVGEKSVTDMAQKWSTKINISILKPRFLSVILYSRDISLMPQMVFGQVVPAYASAGGKVLLAEMPAEQLAEWLQDFQLKPLTPHTITEEKVLLEELEKIRSQGYAVEDEEIVLNRSCVGAPIFDMYGKVIAAVSFSDAKEKIVANLDEMIVDVVGLANTISFDLGYRRHSLDNFWAR